MYRWDKKFNLVNELLFWLLLYLSKVTNFKQITTRQSWYQFLFWLLFYLSKVTNYKQIITGNELQTNHNILMSWSDDIQLNLTDRAISCTVSL